MNSLWNSKNIPRCPSNELRLAMERDVTMAMEFCVFFWPDKDFEACFHGLVNSNLQKITNK